VRDHTVMETNQARFVPNILEADSVGSVLDIGTDLHPASILSLGTVIGLAMMAQSLAQSRVRANRRKLPIIPWGSKKKKRRKKKKKRPTRPTPSPILGPEMFENKDYEYIDQEDIEKLRDKFENNRKTSEKNSEEADSLELKFEPVDYSNYEYDEVGLLDFKEPPLQGKTDNQLSKRQYLAGLGKIHIVSRKRLRPPPGVIAYLRPKVGRSPFLEGLGSRFDFSTMVTIAGLWYIWQAYLSDLVPNTILQDFVNSIGRSATTETVIKQLLRDIADMEEDYYELSQYSEQ